MKSSISLFALISTLFFASSFTVQEACHGRWEKLGSKKVDYRLDKDVIQVGYHKGGFKQLKMEVTGGTVNVHQVTIAYGNGQKDKIRVQQSFKKGQKSRVLDLPGNKRAIKSITLWYDTKNRSRKKASVHIFGKH